MENPVRCLLAVMFIFSVLLELFGTYGINTYDLAENGKSYVKEDHYHSIKKV